MQKLQSSVADIQPKLLHNIGFRNLSAEQRATITEALKSLGNKNHYFVIDSDMSCADCASYAASFLAVFPQPPWTLQMPKVLGPSDASPKGLALLTPDPSHPLPEAEAVAKALRAANIDFEIKRGAEEFFIPGGTGPIETAGLLITSQAIP